jgi:hypothetical protein
MILTKIFLFLNLILIYKAQVAPDDQQIEIKFLVGENEVELNNDFKMYFTNGPDTIFPIIRKNYFIISNASTVPDSLNICFLYKDFNLVYENVKRANILSGIAWVIKIDKRPFDKQEYWYLKSKLRKINWLYTLNFGTGSILTVYRFTKPPNF